MNSIPTMLAFLAAAFIGPASHSASLTTLLDPTFSPDSAVLGEGSLTAVSEDAQGRLLVAASGTNLVRLLSNGARDPSFLPGTAWDGIIRVIVPSGDGRTYVGGSFRTYAGVSKPALLRLLADGTVDGTFSAAPNLGGLLAVQAVAPAPDGGLLVGGSFSHWLTNAAYGLVRIGSDGTLDPSFTRNLRPLWGGATIITTYSTNIDGVPISVTTTNVSYDGPATSWSGTGRIVARPGGGWVTSGGYIAVLDPDGVPTSLPPDSAPIPDSFGPWITLDDVRILMAENRPSRDRRTAELVLRHLDPAQGWSAAKTWRQTCNGNVSLLVDLHDGSFVVAGAFTEIGGHRRDHLARILPDGTVDPDFQVLVGTREEDVGLFRGDGWYDPGPLVVFRDSQGRLVIAGAFTTVDGQSVPRLARLASRPLPAGSPVIGTTPARIDLTEDAPAQLGVTVSAKSPWTARWTKDGTPVPGATNGVLDLGGARLSHAGIYRLRVENAVGSTESNPIQLTVGMAPSHPGTVDRTFRGPALVSAMPNSAEGLTVVGGRLHVFGEFEGADDHVSRCLVRLLADGSVDTSFVTLRGAPEAAALKTIQWVGPRMSGGILALAEFNLVTRPPGHPAYRLLALREDGSADPAFPILLPDQGSSSRLDEVVPWPDGRLLVRGGLPTPATGRGIVRLLSDGSLDPAFPRFTNGVLSSTRCLGLPDGRIFLVQVGGTGGTAGGIPAVRRLLADGRIDPGFQIAPNILEGLSLLSANVDGQGRLLLGGQANSGGSTPALLRILPDGSADPSFIFQTPTRNTAPPRVTDIVLGATGDIYCSIWYGTYLHLRSNGSPDESFSFADPNSLPVLALATGRPDELFGLTQEFQFTIQPPGGGIRRFNLTDERRLDAASFAEGRFSATVNTRIGRRYEVQAAHGVDVHPTDWHTIQVIDGDGTSKRVSDPDAGSRFYRLRLSDTP